MGRGTGCSPHSLKYPGRHAEVRGYRVQAQADRHCSFEFAYQNIKPIDAAIVGMYPRYSDQITEDKRIVSEVLKA